VILCSFHENVEPRNSRVKPNPIKNHNLYLYS
jgi:hypothetical protein